MTQNYPNVLKSANKLINELNEKIPPMKKSIKEINNKLFGNPKNPEWRSVLGDLEEEIDHPATREHPIADRMSKAITEFRKLNKEHKNFEELFEAYLKDMLQLFSELNNLHEKKIKELTELKAEVEVLKKPKEEKKEEEE